MLSTCSRLALGVYRQAKLSSKKDRDSYSSLNSSPSTMISRFWCPYGLSFSRCSCLSPSLSITVMRPIKTQSAITFQSFCTAAKLRYLCTKPSTVEDRDPYPLPAEHESSNAISVGKAFVGQSSCRYQVERLLQDKPSPFGRVFLGT